MWEDPGCLLLMLRSRVSKEVGWRRKGRREGKRREKMYEEGEHKGKGADKAGGRKKRGRERREGEEGGVGSILQHKEAERERQVRRGNS